MSNYKAGKPVLIGAIVLLIAAIVIPFAVIGFILLATDISYKKINERVNLNYYEQLIIKTDKLVVFYDNMQYSNLSDEFRSYYSESHNTPVDNSSYSGLLSSDADSFFVCAVDGNYVFKATYWNDLNKFELCCVPSSFDNFMNYNYDAHAFWSSSITTFPYNSLANWNNLISYFK